MQLRTVIFKTHKTEKNLNQDTSVRKKDELTQDYHKRRSSAVTVITENEGRFHCWGVEYEEFDGGPGNYTVAIVEDMRGVIYKITPEDIRFCDM